MKRNLSVALLLSMILMSCAPKIIYVDRPVNTNNSTPANTNDNQAYQPPVNNNPPQNNQQYSGQQYNGGGGQDNNTNQQQYNNGGQQQYNDNNQQYNNQADQQYNANQQQVNYGAPSYQTFYDDLAPYGSWVNYQNYGNVWMPAQGADFTPYATNGQWVYTDYGWTWASNYSWGWAPFHYGRWLMDPMYGWLWVPGNTWAPAWVAWGQYNGYYGWAPVGPGVYNYEGYRPPVNQWCFVPQNQVTQPNVNSYVVNHSTNEAIVNHDVTNVSVINNTTNNQVYNAGPKIENVENAVGHKVNHVAINETGKPVQPGRAVNGNSLSLYKPAIAQNTQESAKPANVVSINNGKIINSFAMNGVIKSHQPLAAPAKLSAQPVKNGQPIKVNDQFHAMPQPNKQQPAQQPNQQQFKPASHTPQNPKPIKKQVQPKPAPKAQPDKRG
jgi:hypothetical protein